MLQIYNSMSKSKIPFKPIRQGHVGLYVCGMTVYDYCHIGHARSMVCFDTIVRYLRYRGYEVTHVRNITDIDDKIIKRAQENNETTQHLTQRFIDALHEDSKALQITPPTHEPRATEYIAEMIALVKSLQDKGYAYVTENGDVCYDVSKFKDYGCLSCQDLEKLRAGERVSINEKKDDPLDFVLWKMAKPGEPSWSSPWGDGRPGWHLECSAMSCSLLGNNFDFHGGGTDLLFPHHENEIAQSVAATGDKFANAWIHAGFVNINDEKMSKSLGNFFTIREVLAKYPGEVLRYFLAVPHYRSQINYNEESLEAARQSLDRFYQALRGVDYTHIKAPAASSFEERFQAAMDDDFNTPEALAVLFDLVKELNRLKISDMQKAAEHAALLVKLANILGLATQDPEVYFRQEHQVDVQKVEALIAERQTARANKDWAKADQVRQQLTDMNIVIEDSAQGTIWRSVG